MPPPPACTLTGPRTWTVTRLSPGQSRGQDVGDFDIDSADGVLTFKEEPDYEIPADSDANNQYLVTVVATDDQGREGTLDVTITVTEVNEGPEITGTSTYTVTEGQELTGATFTAEDPEDATAAVTSWRLAGSDAGDFNIASTGTNSAQLTFRSTPDYDSPVRLQPGQRVPGHHLRLQWQHLWVAGRNGNGY